MPEQVGYAKVKWEWRGSAQRDGESFDLGIIAGGNLWQRIHSAYRIVRWNQWAAKDARDRGMAFPEDAPRRLRDVDWRKVVTDK